MGRHEGQHILSESQDPIKKVGLKRMGGDELLKEKRKIWKNCREDK